MKGLMRSLIVIVLGGALAACTPGGGGSPTPTVTPTPSVTPTPTPQWTPEEQGAIDGVFTYLEVASRIQQDLGDGKWDEIYDVAADQALDDTTTLWAEWYRKGWHIVGTPGFIPRIVTSGAGDGRGQRYHVDGCYILTGVYLVDSTGSRVGNTGAERRPIRYLVIRLKSDGSLLVLEDSLQEGTC